MRSYLPVVLLSCLAPIVAASPQPAPTPVLQLRQSNDFPISIPSNCTSQCAVVNTIASCTSDSSNTTCLCSNTIGSELLQCINCGVSLGGVLQQQMQAAQSQLNSFVSGCDDAGATISPLTIVSATGGQVGPTSSPSPSPSPTGAALKANRIPGGMVGLVAGVVLSICIVGL
ncbi:hypothetical protein CALVIDRAFT_536302 [Calocera viscosa TUFC12733]|uniref:Extracellular membrane protein CFEM domain-containing protein n=1 Tax=Calocera viscosa (strain TUFC12733) TaxID=1330018 RepID=A0A167N258_CALVF|nr:hypothetical protein CALVIDRAFT_536302 [Calocera viscosa TUFC12733]